ncbi:AbrB family transcriptional regulator [Ruminococcaceae bacterium OttesenSCG-928-L11]|nr:AbrB family transcriptional regulator [Ruminococcaceae bacterium OttesenSCG-928-L11]
MDLFHFLLTVLLAALGGLAGYKLKLPAGALVGAILGVVLLNLTLGTSFFYADIKVGLQFLSGAMIGSKIGKKDVLEIRNLVLPALFLLAGMVVLNLTFGGLIYKFSSLDVATALFSTAPGGMADMAIISSELGANTSYVAILQLFRILVIFIFMPPLFKKILSRRASPAAAPVPEKAVASARRAQPAAMLQPALAGAAGGGVAVHAAKRQVDNPAPDVGLWKSTRNWVRENKRFFVLVAVAVAGGLLFRALGVAAGALTGGMIASAAYCVWKGTVQFPSKLKIAMQILSGAFIGIGIDRERLMTLPELFVPCIIMFVGIFAFVFLTSFAMHKLFHLDLTVCLLSSTPGGVQEMSLLSEDLGADTPKIAILQTTRLMCVILLFPTMLRAITLLFG